MGFRSNLFGQSCNIVTIVDISLTAFKTPMVLVLGITTLNIVSLPTHETLGFLPIAGFGWRFRQVKLNGKRPCPAFLLHLPFQAPGSAMSNCSSKMHRHSSRYLALQT